MKEHNHFENYLIKQGYHKHDATNIVVSFLSGGFDQIKKDFNDWDNDAENYTDEIIGNIELCIDQEPLGTYILASALTSAFKKNHPNNISEDMLEIFLEAYYKTYNFPIEEIRPIIWELCWGILQK